MSRPRGRTSSPGKPRARGRRRRFVSLLSVVTMLLGLTASLPLLTHASAADAPAVDTSFHAIAPVPVLDSATGVRVAKGKVAASAAVDVPVLGVGSVPASGVAAVVLQIAAPEPGKHCTAVTAYATGSARPSIPTLVLDGHPGATTAIVPVGTAGRVTIANCATKQHLLASVSGYWTGTGDLTPLAAAAILDTGSGVGVPKGPLTKGTTVDVQVAGRGGVPASGVTAVALQLSTIETFKPGFVTVWASGATRPPAPTMVLDGMTNSMTAIVPLGADGKISVYSGAHELDLSIAVSGYWKAGSELVAVPPAPVLDATAGVGGPKAKVKKHGTVDVHVTGVGGIPATGVTAVALQLTALKAREHHSVTAYAAGTPRPRSASLLVGDGSTSTTVIVPVGSSGTVSITNGGESLDLVASVVAYWRPAPPAANTAAIAPLGSCVPALTVALDATPNVAVQGGSVKYGVSVRNDPTGPCFDVAGATLLTGSVHLSAGSATDQLTDIAVWLEAPGSGGSTVVLPTSANLAAGTSCPGDDKANCTSAQQPTFGHVNYPSGPALPFTTPLPIPAAGLDVPFRFFPSLSAADRDLLAATKDAKLAVAVTASAGGLQTLRAPVTFASAPSAPATSVKVTLPDANVVTADAGDVAAGGEAHLDSAASYTVRAVDPDTISASAQAFSGSLSSPPVTTQTSVILDPASRAPLLPTASPDIVSPGHATPVFFAVTPTVPPEGAVELVDPSGTSLGELKDDGTDGDLVAGDGAFGGTFSVSRTADGTYKVRTTENGTTVTGSVTIRVAEAGEPLASAPADTTDTFVDASTGASVIRTQILVTTAPDATFPQLKAAAASVGGTVVGRIDATSWQIGVPAIADDAALTAIVKTISGSPGIIGAEPNGLSEVTDVRPNDPSYGAQWHLPYIRANEAWAFNRGDSPNVVVAVLDTGVHASHEDLGNVVKGRDVVNNDDNADDDYHHGTHVAGIIGATANNAKGVAGVTWNVSILPVKVANSSGILDYSDVHAGVKWAVDHGAKVINMSFGGPKRSEEEAKAVDYAWDRNRLVVASAGNDNCSERAYPAGFNRTEHFSSWFGLNGRDYDTELLAVGANDATGHRSIWKPGQKECTPGSGSNHGSWVDVAAPGTDIYSTWVDPTQPNNTTYHSDFGTSMATPVATGVAALVWSREPSLSAGDVKARLMSTARPLAANQDIGTGSVDAFAATFNGGFEAGTQTWKVTGTANSVSSLGPIKPRSGSWMGYLSTGPAGAVVTSSLTKSVRIDPAVLKDGHLRFSFQYDYVTEEYPEFVGTQFNDDFIAKITVPSTGKIFPITSESVNATTFSSVTGIDFPGGDSTVGQSGWKTATVDIPADQLGNAPTIELVVSDRGDAIYDSVVLLDDFRVQ